MRIKLTLLSTLALVIGLTVGIVPSAQAETLTFPCGPNGETYSIIIPGGIVAGGKKCSGDLIIDDRATKIDNFAFFGSQLTSIVIPSSVTTIGESAFVTGSLTKISIPDSVTTIESCAFAQTSITSVIMPQFITSISPCLFAFSKIKSIVIPSKVIKIGEAAFMESALEKIEFSNSLESIDAKAFFKSKISIIDLPNSLKVIGFGAFSQTPLHAINFGLKTYDIRDTAFAETLITSIDIPSSVLYIGDKVFDGAIYLERISIPDNLISLGKDAFNRNYSLKEIKYCGKLVDFPISTICPPERKAAIDAAEIKAEQEVDAKAAADKAEAELKAKQGVEATAKAKASGACQSVIAPASISKIQVALGYQGPLSGGEASNGIYQQNAVKYAIKLFNESNPDYSVSLISVDDQGDPAVAGTVAPGIGKNKAILGVVGPAYSGATIASLPFYKAGGLVMISPSANRVPLTDSQSSDFCGPVFHRIQSAPGLSKEGLALAKLATQGVTNAKVFVFDDQSFNYASLPGYVKAGLAKVAGATLVGIDSVPDTTTDYRPTIAKIKASGADVVIYTGYYSQAAVFIKQLRDSGSKAIFAGGSGVFNQEFLQLAGAAAEGTRLLAESVSSLSDISPALESDYQARMGSASGTNAAESIDAVNIFLTCIAKGSVTRLSMLDCVNNFDGKSIYGSSLSFNIYGDNPDDTFHGYEVSSGQFKSIDIYIFDASNILNNFPWAKSAKPADVIPVPAIDRNKEVAAELKAQQAAEAKIAADKAAADLKAKQEAAAKASAATKKTTITCVKGKLTKKVTAVKPVCPKGYKKKD